MTTTTSSPTKKIVARRSGGRRKAASGAALTDFLVACASEADPEVRIGRAKKALAEMPASNVRGQLALRALLAHARVDAGDPVGARREWLALAKLSPVRARIEAGLLAESIGRLELAEKDYRAALARARTPDERAETCAILGRFLVRREQPERALDVLAAGMRRSKHPLLPIASAYIHSRRARAPEPLERFRATLVRDEKRVPLYGYFLGFLHLWDGRAVEAVRALRGFVSRGVDHLSTWGRELAPELDHARRTILQLEAAARVPMP